MSDLAFVSLISGVIVLAAGLGLALMPQRTANWMRRFPRHVWAGRLLTGICVVWSAVLLLQAGFDWVDAHRWFVYPAIPVAFGLIIVLMDELLAARALGGLLLLVPLPILDSAFMHPSASRLVMTVFAYLLVVCGMVLVWSPYKLRRWVERWLCRPNLARFFGLMGCALGSGMLWLGGFVY